MRYYVAQDTFVADLKDGTSVRIARGDPLPDGHELVKRDQAGTGQLFKPLNPGEEDQPAASPAPKSRAAKSGS